MISAVNYWLNMFPQKDSVSNTVSSCTLLTVLTMNYNCYCHLEFGKYVQTHEECNNSMGPRMIEAFALQPTGNIKGGYFFLSLSTSSYKPSDDSSMSTSIVNVVSHASRPKKQHLSRDAAKVKLQWDKQREQQTKLLLEMHDTMKDSKK